MQNIAFLPNLIFTIQKLGRLQNQAWKFSTIISEKQLYFTMLGSSKFSKLRYNYGQ